MKKKIIKSFITIILTIAFSMTWIVDSPSITIKTLGLLNGYFMSLMLVEVFVSMHKLDEKKEKMTKNTNIFSLMWAITFLILNTIKYGTVIKLLNALAAIVIVTSIISLVSLRKKDRKEVDSIRFGYIWVGCVLLIPVVLIFVLMGY